MKKRPSYTHAVRVSCGQPTNQQLQAFGWQLLSNCQPNFQFGLRRLSSGVVLKGHSVAFTHDKNGCFNSRNVPSPIYTVVFNAQALTKLPVHMNGQYANPGFSVISN